jgi:ABC-type amino acid transport substrate-binding protein
MTQTAKTILISLLVSIAVTVTLVGWLGLGPRMQTAQVSAPKETVFARIKRTGTIRCGYGIWPPFFNKDATTGEFSGVYYDYLNEIGKALNLKIEWVTEVNWGDFASALNNDRVDVFCAPLAATSARVAQAYFVNPISFTDYRFFARAGDARFENNSKLVNSPETTIAVMEGELSSILAHRLFPKAKFHEITTMQGPSQLIMDVVDSKADLVFVDQLTVDLYEKSNPGKIQRVHFAESMGRFGFSMPVKMGENELLWTLNAATADMINLGIMDQILDKHGITMDGFYRLAKPYQAPVQP